jgi:hypothetical protein
MKIELITAVVATVGLASAAFADCLHTVGERVFEAQGGKLVRRKMPIVVALPPRGFFCDRIACSGAVTFSGVVETDGRPRHLRIVSNSWEVRPGFHASVSGRIVSRWRYEPPMLGDHPVCVKKKWVLDFRPAEQTK